MANWTDDERRQYFRRKIEETVKKSEMKGKRFRDMLSLQIDSGLKHYGYFQEALEGLIQDGRIVFEKEVYRLNFVPEPKVVLENLPEEWQRVALTVEKEARRLAVAEADNIAHYDYYSQLETVSERQQLMADTWRSIAVKATERYGHKAGKAAIAHRIVAMAEAGELDDDMRDAEEHLGIAPPVDVNGF